MSFKNVLEVIAYNDTIKCVDETNLVILVLNQNLPGELVQYHVVGRNSIL